MAVLLSFVGQTVFVSTNYWISRSIGADINYGVFFILIPVSSIVSMAPSIGGLGVREASLIYLFSRYLPSERALALTVLMDVIIYLFGIGSGVWYGFRGGLKHNNSAEVESMQTSK